MPKIVIKTDFITLSQFLKLANIVSSGGEAKNYLLNNKILVNGEKENRKGKKLYRKDHIKLKDGEYEIC